MDEQEGRQDAADLHNEHHRILDLVHGIQFSE
jgi:hypothetical protein